VSATAIAGPAVESVDSRRRRRTTGVFLLVLALALLALGVAATNGRAKIALTSNFSDQPASLPGSAVVVTCGLVAVAVAVLQVLGRLARAVRVLLMIVFALAILVGFIVWSASGRDLPFQLVNQLQQTITLAVPLVFGALSGSVGERAGVINVAIEGHFLAAAFSSALVASITGSLVAGLVAAVVAGVAMALLLGVFALRYRVNQVVLGVVLNVLASGVTGFLYDQLMQSAQDKYNAGNAMPPYEVPLLGRLPFLGPVLFNQSPLTYLCYAAVPAVFVALYKTRWGLRVRAVGEHPGAADTVGVRVDATRYGALVVAGALAGLGGAFFTIGFNGGFGKDMTAGYGFIALAAVIMGRWHPLSAAGMALFFGFVNQLQQQVALLETPIPQQVLQMLPYLATIVAVAGLVGRVRAPAADGQPYAKA
jgi:general nucleoside transport system permease protein